MNLQPFVRGVTPDATWDDDTKPTNYSLKAGDAVTLCISTKGDFSTGVFVVPAGTTGKVVNARTPRVTRRIGSKSAYFANVDVYIEGTRGRIRVPHGVLRKVREHAHESV
jgi:hypothetical protein